MTCHPEMATSVIKAACVLHNFLQDMGDPICCSTLEEIYADPRQVVFTGQLQSEMVLFIGKTDTQQQMICRKRHGKFGNLTVFISESKHRTNMGQQIDMELQSTHGSHEVQLHSMHSSSNFLKRYLPFIQQFFPISISSWAHWMPTSC